jgi:hypothetical protein
VTRMLPAAPHSSVRSQAERRLFDVIRDAAGTDDWVCVHSLGLARHSTKRRGEIDFALIMPEGVVVLEVKGGRVERRGGYWVHTDRFGVAHTKGESPFDQASSAMFALERDLRERFGRGSRIGNVLLGFGVLLPDVEFEALGVEAERAQVYDVRDARAPFALWVRKLVDSTRARQRRQRNGLVKSELASLVDYLRGDFALVPSFDVTATDINRGLHRLTRRQAAVVADFDRYPRLVVKGSAGTGKSLLAVEALRREVSQGKRALLLCYNRFLGAKLLAAAAAIPGAYVRHAHGFMRDVIAGSPFARDFDIASSVETDAKRLYGELYPEFASLALTGAVHEPFDAVVIDEAQDLLAPAFVDVVDQALRGGIDGGRWRIFLDANEQAAIYGRLDDRTLARLEMMGPVSVLPLNCRNTTQIHLATRAIAQPRSAAMASQQGEAVERRWFEDDASLTKQLRQVLDELSDQSVPPGCITVLYPRLTDGLERAFAAMRVKGLALEDVPLLGTKDLSGVTHATASAFKGLENDVIVMAGVEKVNGDWSRAAAYVALSRARVRLYVLAHVAVRPTVDARFAALLHEAMEDST